MGEGPTMLLIHDLGESAKIMLHVMEYLKKSFHCVSISLRGHGKSTLKTPIKELKDYSTDIQLFIE